jgi:hypothetical protein
MHPKSSSQRSVDLRFRSRHAASREDFPGILFSDQLANRGLRILLFRIAALKVSRVSWCTRLERP